MTAPNVQLEAIDRAVAAIRGRSPQLPAVGLVLGSGLGGFADSLGGPVAIPYQDIPGLPVSRVPGHPGRLVLGTVGSGVVVAALQGRAHTYEGWSASEVAFGVRVLCRLGIGALVITNAAGGINPILTPGDLVRVTDHLNLSGQNPLRGANDDGLGPRFPDLSQAYDARLGQALEASARAGGVNLKAGVYACMPGPSYETPAEIRMLRALGADLVGMSTVPEVIAARHLGVPVAAVSVVTNYAAGMTTRPLSHEEVAETAERVRDRLAGLLRDFLPRAAEIGRP
jgi:purine-nucleoside phosphorylase